MTGASARWLVTGAGGMLGRSLVAALGVHPGAKVTALRRDTLDITDGAALWRHVPGHDVVINTAAYTDVDGAESDEAWATAVNGHSIARLAEACGPAVFVQVSTDYVFDGAAVAPYPEDAPTAPINAYGRSKLVGERAVPGTGYVVRTGWLYAEHGRNFVRTMLSLAAQRQTVSVVDDQYGQPTSATAVAAQLVALAEAALDGRAPGGIYHGTAAGSTTWHGLVAALYEEAGLDPARVLPTGTAAFPRRATRPAYSVLGHDRWAAAGIAPQPHWREQLRTELRRPEFRPIVAAAQCRVARENLTPRPPQIRT
jgi:dTDP-4-dehydrorhamnose reductase